MKYPQKRRLSARTWALVATLTVLISTPGRSQSVIAPSASPTPAQLAKYDTNKNGRLDSGELAALQRDEAAATVPSAEIVQLSPFEVSSESDRGYYASASLSGTRLNSNLADLAASITVVTKQQLLDTGALDLNDVFLYEANTEGLYQYTEFTQDRSFYNETTTLNPQSANRVRGISAANMARSNFATSSSIPVDTYNVQAVEISRGPNSNIFGLGDASGTVNLIPLEANSRQESTQLVLRGDSYGGWRAQFDVNRPLVPNRFGLRVSVVHDEKGFVRQPASEVINRHTLAFNGKPFPNTTVRASFESYRNHYNRANTSMMRDAYTEWRDNGMPVWNPTFGTTGGWRPLNGTTYTAVSAANEGTQFPRGLFPGSNGFWQNPSAYVVHGELQRYEVNRANNNLTSPGSGAEFRYVETGTIYRRGGNALGIPPLVLYQPTSLTDKSIYDYTDLNFLAPNYGKDRAETYTGEIEHYFLRSNRHVLGLQFGYMGERVGRYDHNFFSKSDAGTPFLMVDVNEFYIDGTRNPYFLRPYMGASQPRIAWRSEENDNFRGTLAYQLDLTREKGRLKWLGRQRFAGYAEYRGSWTESLTGGDRNITDYAWTSVNDRASLAVRGNTYRLYPRYYVGGPVTDPGPIVDYAPLGIKDLGATRPFIWYGSNRSPITEQAQIDGIVTGGSARRREIQTRGAVWQGFFLNERIVPTFGWRQDKPREKASRNLNANPPNANAASTIDPETRLNDLSYLREYPAAWVENSGRTKTAGVVVKPLPWLNLHYNQSDSFQPEVVRYDIHLKQVPNPTGDGKDYGVSVRLFNDKLVAKLNKYETVQKNSRSGATSGAFAARTFRFFFDADTNLSFNSTTRLFDSSDDPWDLEQQGAQWAISANPNLTPEQAIDQGRSTYLTQFGFDAAYIARVREIGLGGFAEVNTVTSKGYELELAFNPSRFWTLKLTGARQQTIDTELSQNLNNFFDQNLATLEKIVIPTVPYTVANGTAGRNWWTTGATSPTSTATPQTFYFQNILTTLKQASANAGKPRPQTREYRFAATTTYQLAGLTENKWLKNVSLGGSMRWEDRAALGYYGDAPIFNGAVVSYDPSRPIYDKARAYYEIWGSYRTRLFNKTNLRVQLNVKNPFENGRLQPFVYNPDGVPWNYRIIDPRQFILTATFDL
jgi:hypothetical protein